MSNKKKKAVMMAKTVQIITEYMKEKGCDDCNCDPYDTMHYYSKCGYCIVNIKDLAQRIVQDLREKQ